MLADHKHPERNLDKIPDSRLPCSVPWCPKGANVVPYISFGRFHPEYLNRMVISDFDYTYHFIRCSVAIGDEIWWYWKQVDRYHVRGRQQWSRWRAQKLADIADVDKIGSGRSAVDKIINGHARSVEFGVQVDRYTRGIET